jgi:glycosyltransferase involved in cell wall biosynthesis
MRILHIIPYFFPAWAYGGTCRAAWELARALVRKNQEVVVLTTDALDSYRRADLRYEVVDGVEIYRVPNLSNHLAWGRLFLPLAFGSRLLKELPRADVVHLHEYRSYQNAVAIGLLERANMPFVLTPQGSVPRIMGRFAMKAVYDNWFGQRTLQNAARLHALNELERQQFIDLKVPPERISILPNGVDLDEYRELPQVNSFRKEYNISESAPVVLFLARINKIKGVDFLISAFEQVQKQVPDAVLLIVGPDDGYLTEVQRQVAGLGLQDKVRFTGYLEGEKKLQAYLSSDVYVLPSSYEMFAITLLESLACGTPIIATDRCGLADYVRQHQLGSIVNFGDIPTLCEEIVTTLQNPEKTKTRAIYGRQYVLEHFGWDSIAANWLGVYCDCMEDAEKKRRKRK